LHSGWQEAMDKEFEELNANKTSNIVPLPIDENPIA